MCIYIIIEPFINTFLATAWFEYTAYTAIDILITPRIGQTTLIELSETER